MLSYDESLSGLIGKPCLYSTIFATQVDTASGEVIEPLYDKAGACCEAIAHRMETFCVQEYPTNNLMRYFSLPGSPQTEASIRSKIRSARVTVEAVGETLYAKLELDMAADLTKRELNAFEKQIESQYRDGWGAEFELLDISAGTDSICLRLWHDGISFFTGEQFALEHQEDASDRSEKQPIREQPEQTAEKLSIQQQLAAKPVPGDRAAAKPPRREER